MNHVNDTLNAFSAAATTSTFVGWVSLCHVMAFQCLACREDAGTEGMTRGECDHFYHLGWCSGVPAVTYKLRNEAYHKVWKF